MTMTIPDEVLLASRMTEAELRQEIAIMLFQREKLTMGQACRYAQMDRLAFQHLLASRSVNVHYGIRDFEDDIRTLDELQSR